MPLKSFTGDVLLMQSEMEWREQWDEMIRHTKHILQKKWFVMDPDDVSSIVDLQISKAYRRAKINGKTDFVLTSRNIIAFTERAIGKEIRKWPGVERIFLEDNGKKKKKYLYHGCSSLDAPTNLDDQEGPPMVDLLEANNPNIQALLEEKEELEEMKNTLLKYITPRTYQQLVFEIQNHCVSPSHSNLILKLKEKIRNAKSN